MKIISLDEGSFAFILGLLLWCSHMQADNLRRGSNGLIFQMAVTGTVKDATGTLPGVAVMVKGKDTAVLTDANGHYSITAITGDTLIYSYIGFKDVELVVSSAVMDVTLQEDATVLENLVINAGYYTVKDKERTGSIARITSKDIETQPVTNVLATMQGRMAGVSVTQTTGVPGGGFDIQIRGRNSLRSAGNSPLYIIDGVPYATEAIGHGQTATVLPTPTSPLNSINPSEIESIEVLKDADATAIYGSRGANGVVLITTKKGKGGKTNFSATYSRGFGRVTNYMDMLDTAQYLAMRDEAFANDGIAYGPADYDVNGTWDRDRYTDWQKELIGGTADIMNVQASFGGGSERTQFLFSSVYSKETTVFPGNFGYNKGGARLQLSHTSSDDRFHAGFTAGYTAQKNKQPGLDPTAVATTLAPNAPALYDQQGDLNWENSTWTNPLGEFEGIFGSKTNDLIANALLSYKVIEGLELRASLGYTDTRHKESRTLPNTIYDPAYGIGPEYSTLYLTNTARQSYIIEPQIAYAADWGKLGMSALAGVTFQQLTSEQLALSGTGFSSNSLISNMAAAAILDPLSHLESDYRYNAAFARLNLNWDKRYIINLTGRRDGSSRFGPGSQFASFGAIGAAWLFSSEAFLADSKVLSYGKLRGSYGITGNDQIGDYQYLDTYAVSPNSYSGSSGLQPTRLFNPGFGWEENRKLELALETGWLYDRIMLSAGWYRNRSSNQLIGIPLPVTTGFPSIQANLDAVVENSGWEISLSSQNWKTGSFTWSTDINLTIARNKLLSFPGLQGSSLKNTYVVGQPLNIRKMYQYTGIDPETGLYQFKDFNGDGIITSEDDSQAICDLNPKFFGGVVNRIAYKGIAFDFLFQFVKQDNYNEKVAASPPGTMVNQPAGVMDRWTSPGSGGQYQRFTTGVDSDAVTAFSRYMSSNAVISDASFIRLKNVSLSYTLPQEVTKGITCKIFVEGQNLLTITGYKGRDPEFTGLNFLPPLKIVTTGIQLNF
jgi:TonB-linked SusC/RagA family outer membrane protein